MFATYFASVKKRWNAKCWFARGRLVSHTQESESRPVWGNTFLECLRRPQQHVESCAKPPLLLPSPWIGPIQNVCDIFCISEKSSFAQVLDCKWMALVSVSRFSREQDRTFLLATKC